MFSKGKCFDPYTNALDRFFEKIYADKAKEFGFWILGLKWLKHSGLLLWFGHVSR